MSTKSPAFQFYPHDFLAGRVATYSLEEVGAYITLLGFDWTLNGLPKSIEKLAKICRVSSRRFEKIWLSIADQFEECDDGRLRNPRLQAERMKQLAYSESMSENGKKGGRPKKPEESHGLAAVKPDESSPSPSPSSNKEQLLGDDVTIVLDHFRAKHPRRKVGKRDPGVVRAALKLGYSSRELCLAIDGNANDTWHCEQKKHELTYVLREPGKIDGFIAKAESIDDDEPITDAAGVLTSYGDRLTRPAFWQ